MQVCNDAVLSYLTTTVLSYVSLVFIILSLIHPLDIQRNAVFAFLIPLVPSYEFLLHLVWHELHHTRHAYCDGKWSSASI